MEDIGDGDVQEDETGWGLGLLLWTWALMMSSPLCPLPVLNFQLAISSSPLSKLAGEPGSLALSQE